MEMDLKHIIEKIKKEGVGQAEQQAADIIEQAEEKAANIIRTAEKQKEEIVEKAGTEADRLKKNAEEAIRQASRDVLLKLRENITDLFDNIVKKEVAAHLSSDVLKEMIVHLAQNFQKDGTTELEVLLSEKDKANLEKVFFEGLNKKFDEGVTLKVSSGIENGFRIGKENGEAYYDFTDEAISDAFKIFLNPKIGRIFTGENDNA